MLTTFWGPNRKQTKSQTKKIVLLKAGKVINWIKSLSHVGVVYSVFIMVLGESNLIEVMSYRAIVR